MSATVSELLADAAGFYPHGHCFLWTPALLWADAIADGSTTVAYLAIAWWLFGFARRRPDMPLRTLLVLFGAFITLCGLSHVVAVWNLWHADYWAEAALKLLTATASLGTAIATWRLMPLVLALPSPLALQADNRTLERRAGERTRELQQLNRELEAERSRLQAVIEMAMDAIITMDEQQRIVVFNRAAELMFGYASAEVAGQPLDMLMPERFRGGHADLVRGFGRTAMSSRRMGARNPIIALRRSGEEFAIEASISHTESGGVQLFTVIIRDVSARLRADASLRWLAGIVASSGDAIISESLDGRITSWNDAAEALLGWSADEMIGHPLALVMPPEVAAAAARNRERLRAGEQVKPYDTWRARKDGSTVQVSIALSPVRDADGNLTGFSAITRDVTERRRTEDQLTQALAQQETLLKEVYHRVKNNLQVVTSLFNLQLRKLPPGLARQSLEESASRVRSMALVHEMLYQSDRLSSINLAVYVEDLCSQLAMAYNATAREIQLTVEAEAVAASLDLAVPLGLTLNELVTNSLKHGFSGRASGRIAVRLRHLEGRRVRLEVRDDGVGFTPPTALGEPGTLGLQLVESLARQIDGALFMESDGGARVWVEFDVPAQDSLNR